MRVFGGDDDSYASALDYSIRKFWPAVLATCIIGAVAAWLCCRRQQQYAAHWTWWWAAFVFLVG